MAAAASAVTDKQVGQAIARMQEFFYENQRPGGSWERKYSGRHRGGETAIVTLALLTSGQSHQDPRIERAIDFLQKTSMNGTYAVSMRAHVWAALPDRFLPLLETDARWLQAAQRHGLFSYGPDGNSRYDHSCTQYGVLGLWEHAKRGGRTPRRFWRDVIGHFLKTQNQDGGWGYRSREGDRSSGSMTAAGLTVLYVGLQELYRNQNQAPAHIRKHIDLGLDWLDRHYTPDTNPFGLNFPYYYLYCIERVALASGIKQLNGMDWFTAGARRILEVEGGTGSIKDGFSETAFALMFLARGRVSVWINKVKIPGAKWNNRPNDIYFLNRYLSDQHEREFNWQVVEIDSDPKSWMNAAMAWLSSSSAPKMTEIQQENLKTYLDLGGMLIANAEMRSTRFKDAIKKLAEQMYPRYPMRPLVVDHPLRMAGAHNGAMAVHNGVRDLIFMPAKDWGLKFQRHRPRGRGSEWFAMEQLFSVAYERHRAYNRLIYPFPTRREGHPRGEVRVARARYDGDWNIEPRCWEPLATYLFNATSLELAYGNIQLDQLEGDSGLALIHLAGVDPVNLMPGELEAIRRFIDSGGTVLVETIGGRGDFSVHVQRQLSDFLGTIPVPLEGRDSIISGQGLPGAVDNRRVTYRAFSVLNLGVDHVPRLAAYRINGRPALVISHEDLSLGAMGLRRAGINGYNSESARNLLINLFLFARNLE